MPATDEDNDDIDDMREDNSLPDLDSCCAVRPGFLSSTGTPATEGSRCNSVNIGPGGVRPTRISNEVGSSGAEVVSDEKPLSGDPKASLGISVFLPAIPRLKHNGHIHDDPLELYEDPIIVPN